MSNVLLPTAEVMSELGTYVGYWAAWGVGLSVVFWTIGYVVWFIIQFFR